MKEFIQWAKAKDRVTYGSWGIASWGHLASQMPIAWEALIKAPGATLE